MRAVDLTDPTRSRLLTRITFTGGRAPALALDGATLVYTVRTNGCDVPHVRSVEGGPARRLDRGTCGDVTDLDLEGGRVAVLATTHDDDRRFTEARILRTAGGVSRRLQRVKGSASNLSGWFAIGAVTLDRGSLFTTTYGDEGPDAFTRFSLRTGRRTVAKPFTTLDGSFARDEGRVVYGVDPGGTAAAGFGCGSSSRPIPCQLVAGTDPFAPGTRLLPTALAVRFSAGRVNPGAAVTATVTAARTRVRRTTRVGVEPAAGLPVELVTVTEPDDRNWILRPTGLRRPTDAAGAATFVVDTTTPGTLEVTAMAHPPAPSPAWLGPRTDELEIGP